MSKFKLAEYIWLDGTAPTRSLRSKARALNVRPKPSIEDFPEWSFDGSSTGQAEGKDSDCILKPVSFVNDPIRGEGNFLVMAEVYNPDGKIPHETNSRAQLRAVLDAGAGRQKPWIGFEQEYTLYKNGMPLGWPEKGEPRPQGPYYCSVGCDEAFGRDIAEDHAQLCLDAGLLYYGLNAEVMIGQWEFQIGYRGAKNESADPLTVSDHTWIGRWLLQRVGEEYGVTVSFANKPMKGDWNGAGMHANFSTKQMRESGGMKVIEEAMKALQKKHAQHIALYGEKLGERLTGRHETCDINTFRSGAADRGASIRIPRQVAERGYGYFEDRRPGANADPYLVSARLCATVCGIDDTCIKVPANTTQTQKMSVAAE